MASSADAKVLLLPRRFMSQSSSKVHRVRAVTFTIAPIPKQEIVLAVILGQRLRSRWRTMRSHVRNHVVEIWQELRIKERQNLLVELAWTPGGHHIMVSRVARRPVSIK